MILNHPSIKEQLNWFLELFTLSKFNFETKILTIVNYYNELSTSKQVSIQIKVFLCFRYSKHSLMFGTQRNSIILIK